MSNMMAFLRAINVANRRVKMAPLRDLFQRMGLDGVRTFIASGNVAFAAAASHPSPSLLETQIEAALQAGLGYEVPTFLRSADEIAQLMATQPAIPQEGELLFVLFVKTPLDAAAWQRLQQREDALNQFWQRGRDLYWLRRGDTAVSAATLEKVLQQPGTLRNHTMLHRLMAWL